MRTYATIFFMLLTWFCEAKAQTDPTIIAAEISFHTIGDDKDWNTRPLVKLSATPQRSPSGYYNRIVELDCCTSDRSGDNWQHGIVTKPLIINSAATKSSILKYGMLQIGADAVGEDTWHFNAALKIYYSDGTTSTYSGSGFAGIILRSKGKEDYTQLISLANPN